MKPGNDTMIGHIVGCLMLCQAVSLAYAVDTEHAPVINSNEVLDSAYLSSTYHRVENVGFNNGFYLFDVESEFGRDQIVSRALLKKRVDEIKTLGAAISQFERDNQLLSQELRSELSVSGASAVDILTSPISTASQLAGQLRDNLGDTLAGENPFIEEYAIRYSYVEPDDPTTAQHKRNVAYQLQLDLYSNNFRVQSFLNSVANARAAGRVSAGVGVGQNFFNTSHQSMLDQRIRLALKNKTLAELNRYQRDLLNQMNVNPLVADAFMQQPFISPSNRTVILFYLSQLENVAGLDMLIELISTSDNEVTTLVFERLCKAVYFYSNRVEPVVSYIGFESQPALVSPDRTIIFFEHKDLLVWSEENKSKFEKLYADAGDNGYSQVRLVSLGNFTDLAATMLMQLGYKPRPEFLSNK